LNQPELLANAVAGTRHVSFTVRLEAAQTLGKFGSAARGTPAVAALVALLHDPFDLLPEIAMTALGDIGDSSAIQPIIRRLEPEMEKAIAARFSDRDSSQHLIFGVGALVKLRASEAIPLLQTGYRQCQHDGLRRMFGEALTALGASPPPIPREGCFGILLIATLVGTTIACNMLR
jgi:HEAT repeat protein